MSRIYCQLCKCYGEHYTDECPCYQTESSFAAPPLLEPATKTPRTMRCWRDGRWHADELANLCANLERENAKLDAAEKRAFQKLKEEAAAAGSNAALTDPAAKPKETL